MTTEVEVLLHGQPVGTLHEDDRGQWLFRFSDAYRRRPDRPVLGQKFEDDLGRAYRGKKGSLPPFFANLIPELDGELRPILERHLEIERGDDITLLEQLGRDLPGAVEVRRLVAGGPRPRPLLDEAIDPAEVNELDDEWMRFSLAGVQLKFSVIVARDRITLPVHGRLGDWLVKLDSERFPGLCANEHAIMRWASAAGFEVPEVVLRDAGELVGKLGEYATPGAQVLAIRRYDRCPAGKIHQEDLAQVVNLLPQHKYDHVSYEALTILIGASAGREAQDEVIRRIALMIASGNGDAHLKNWSLVYPDRIAARLAPLYDQVATVAWLEIKRHVALKLGGTREMAQLTRDTLVRFAERTRVDRDRVLGLVDETLDRLAAAWPEVTRAPTWSLPDAHARALREHWERTPLLRESALSRL